MDMASTGTEGLRLWQRTQYDAVVLDIMRNGTESLSAMRHKGDPTPVLVLSASAVEDRVTGLEISADDYMTKPFSFSELISAARDRGAKARAIR